MNGLVVVRAGVATTVQDRGRAGLADLGVGTSGALDRELHDRGNRLVGNPDDAAGLETAGGLVVRAAGALTVFASGDLGPRNLGAGEEVVVEPAPDDQWAYLAVRGGIAVESVLGSRSRDTLAGLGPPPPHDGEQLAVGPDPGRPLVTDVAPRRPRRTPVVVRMWPGPRRDWFEPDALEGDWTVSTDVGRTGVRLRGPRLVRTHEAELPSEGLVLGAVQVPPDGQPVVMLADHPTTGGYPVIGVVDPADLAALIHARPGTTVRWRAT